MPLKSKLAAAAARLGAYAANDAPLAAAGKQGCPGAGRQYAVLSDVRGRPGRKRGHAGAAADAMLVSVFCDGACDLAPQPLLGRATLSLAGTANTLFCTWLLGERSGTELFLIPCITLASLLFGPGERIWMLPLAALPLAAYILLHGHFGPPPHLYQDDAYASLFSMNAISVGTLSIFFGIVFSGLYAGPAKRAN